MSRISIVKLMMAPLRLESDIYRNVVIFRKWFWFFVLMKFMVDWGTCHPKFWGKFQGKSSVEECTKTFFPNVGKACNCVFRKKRPKRKNNVYETIISTLIYRYKTWILYMGLVRFHQRSSDQLTGTHQPPIPWKSPKKQHQNHYYHIWPSMKMPLTATEAHTETFTMNSALTKDPHGCCRDQMKEAGNRHNINLQNWKELARNRQPCYQLLWLLKDLSGKNGIEI